MVDREMLDIAVGHFEAGIKLLKAALEDTPEPVKATTIFCPECEVEMTLREGNFGPFYSCPNYPACDMLVGANPDGSPKGLPVDKDTREARKKAHEAFDPLWRTGVFKSRSAAYKWLAKRLGHDKHMQDMNRMECDQVIELCQGHMAATAAKEVPF